MTKEHHMRQSIKSFVSRGGRMTSAQKKAIENLKNKYCINQIQNPYEAAHNYREIVLEIGFGNGENLINLACLRPNVDFIGIDPHLPGVGRVLLELEREKIENVRILIGDADELIPQKIKAQSLKEVLILFPDPWPKKRHHKRRLLKLEFLKMLTSKIIPGGYLHIATDWKDYADSIAAIIEETPCLINATGKLKFAKRPEWRPVTKYERRGIKLNHRIYDISVIRI